ncbi:MAG: TIGR02757 family protein [Nitrospirota bacterium]
MSKLKKILDRFYREFNFQERLLRDPIEFPSRYKNPRDIEVSGFIASCFAYGRVDLFRSTIGKILSLMGKSPHDFILNFNPVRHGKLFGGIKYRFNETEDIICLLYILHALLKEHDTIESAFKKFYRADNKNIENGLTGLIETFLRINTSGIYGTNIKPAGLVQFLPSPANGSACKRANLFLRWMIRDRDIDFGIWKGIPKNRLVIPLDTHIARISRCLGFTRRRSQGWKTAVEITEALKKFDPEDPLKYDFALCHHGISGMCRGEKNQAVCARCSLNL